MTTTTATFETRTHAHSLTQSVILLLNIMQIYYNLQGKPASSYRTAKWPFIQANNCPFGDREFPPVLCGLVKLARLATRAKRQTAVELSERTQLWAMCVAEAPQAAAFRQSIAINTAH